MQPQTPEWNQSHSSYQARNTTVSAEHAAMKI